MCMHEWGCGYVCMCVIGMFVYPWMFVLYTFGWACVFVCDVFMCVCAIM